MQELRNFSKSENTSNNNFKEKSMEKLYEELRRINKKITYMQALSLYEEEKLEYNFKLD